MDLAPALHLPSYRRRPRLPRTGLHPKPLCTLPPTTSRLAAPLWRPTTARRTRGQQDLNPVHNDAIIVQPEQSKPLLHRGAGIWPLLGTIGQAQNHRHPLNIPRKFRTGPRTSNPAAGQHLIGPIGNRTRNLLQRCPGGQQRTPFAIHNLPRPRPVQMFPFAPRKAPLRNARRVGIGGIRPPGDVQRIADKFISGHGIQDR